MMPNSAAAPNTPITTGNNPIAKEISIQSNIVKSTDVSGRIPGLQKKGLRVNRRIQDGALLLDAFSSGFAGKMYIHHPPDTKTQ
jgi:hypothetical protein